jgi:Zn-dependent M28 family amino/carboxypeptidase
MDDHIPLLQIGIPCIDLIDLDYPYWHTISDTPDKCSASSLDQVGRVLVHLIYTHEGI